jgi:hypothetical protein
LSESLDDGIVRGHERSGIHFTLEGSELLGSGSAGFLKSIVVGVQATSAGNLVAINVVHILGFVKPLVGELVNFLPLTLDFNGLITESTFVPGDSIALLVHVVVSGLNSSLIFLVLLGLSDGGLDTTSNVTGLNSLRTALHGILLELVRGRVFVVSTALLVLGLSALSLRGSLFKASVSIFFGSSLLLDKAGEHLSTERSHGAVFHSGESELHEFTKSLFLVVGLEDLSVKSVGDVSRQFGRGSECVFLFFEVKVEVT